MALLHHQRGVAADGADDRHVDVAFERLAELALLPRRRHPVQDHASDRHAAVENLIAQYQRRHAARDPRDVDDEDDRGADEFRKRCARVAALDVDPVVKPLVALDEREIGPPGMAGEQSADLGLGLRVEVEIVAGPPARAGEPHGIDVVRALLEGLDAQSARTERCRKPDAHHRLARRLVRSRDEELGHAAHTASVKRPITHSIPWRQPR